MGRQYRHNVKNTKREWIKLRVYFPSTIRGKWQRLQKRMKERERIHNPEHVVATNSPRRVRSEIIRQEVCEYRCELPRKYSTSEPPICKPAISTLGSLGWRLLGTIALRQRACLWGTDAPTRVLAAATPGPGSVPRGRAGPLLARYRMWR